LFRQFEYIHDYSSQVVKVERKRGLDLTGRKQTGSSVICLGCAESADSGFDLLVGTAGLSLRSIGLVANPAASFVSFVADLNLRIAPGHALSVVREAATSNAHSVHFRNVFSHRQKRRHRSERTAQVILIQSRCNDSHAAVGKLHTHVDDFIIEELDLVDAYDFHSEDDVSAEVGGVADGYGIHTAIVARDYSLQFEAVVYGRLENLGALAGYLGPSNAAYQLFALAAEHSAGDYFDPPASGTKPIHL
jgi:hypothetical protein